MLIIIIVSVTNNISIQTIPISNIVDPVVMFSLMYIDAYAMPN